MKTLRRLKEMKNTAMEAQIRADMEEHEVFMRSLPSRDRAYLVSRGE